jgi:hypothetical protein
MELYNQIRASHNLVFIPLHDNLRNAIAFNDTVLNGDLEFMERYFNALVNIMTGTHQIIALIVTHYNNSFF